MRKIFIFLVLINIAFIGFSQEQRNNMIVFPVRGHTFIWSFPNYWIPDRAFANSIGEAIMFFINGYTIQNSIALFGISFGDNVSEISIENFAINNMNRWINNVRNNFGIEYIAEKTNWNINRQDNAPILVYKLYSSNNPMYQYCAILQSTMNNYIIAYVQLNIEHEINEVFINDFKSFLEYFRIAEGTFDANDEFVEELSNLLVWIRNKKILII
jgi:hypothetical protein